ncbi:chromosomal replication initiator protein DnaA [[Mycoplasma] falconis]|uniref:Chromosomal replication initiator protein DnaA n=1 Tax=[Mycoplasma] falconis TaxID=92403 RepID=A0A501X845_9BACT|nr:chromosomal replication initiator protein DnaA [[Mycoplasma] falconis]TPE56712.1 chromosomal replication initiator protein DnaA [[Mycoplasma] falconis]
MYSKEKEYELKEKNELFQEEMEKNINEDFAYENYIKPLEITWYEGNTVYMLDKLASVVNHFEKVIADYSIAINRAVKTVFNNNNFEVTFIKSSVEISNLLDQNIKNEVQKKPSSFKHNIKRSWTFDNYTLGEFNSKVIKAAKSICDPESDIIFSPLFIYSNSGLGKTHLLHAIVNEMKKNGLNSRYINPDMFTREIVDNLKSKNSDRINEIVDELIQYDCLMFDDIQQYGTKEQTMVVLFNIISRMIDLNKTVVISSDKKPSDLGGFERRFITRFEGGLILPIEQPTFDDIIKVLKSKLLQKGINPDLWEDESLKFIARNFSSSIRSLEGAINRIKLFAEDDDYFTYDLHTMQSIFKDVTQIKENITPEKVIDAVCKYYKIDRKKMISNVRTQDIVVARRIAIYIIKNSFDYTLKEIGAMVANQDHSTVIASIKWVDKNIKTNPTLKLAIEKIQQNIKKII